MAAADSPFYLASIVKPSSNIWLKKQPLGKNALGSFMKSMSEAVGLTGRHTNHSVLRTMISTLRKENMEPLNIIALAEQLFQYVHRAAEGHVFETQQLHRGM